MNIFLIDPDPYVSARSFLASDAIRARKQLLECCQILASVDHILTGTTTMLKKDGSPYKLAHPHHPITKRCAEQYYQWRLCFDVAMQLANILPEHACAKTLRAWYTNTLDHLLPTADTRLVVCRKGYEHLFVKSREEYADIMSAYLDLKHQRDNEL